MNNPNITQKGLCRRQGADSLLLLLLLLLFTCAKYKQGPGATATLVETSTGVLLKAEPPATDEHFTWNRYLVSAERPRI